MNTLSPAKLVSRGLVGRVWYRLVASSKETLHLGSLSFVDDFHGSKHLKGRVKRTDHGRLSFEHQLNSRFEREFVQREMAEESGRCEIQYRIDVSLTKDVDREWRSVDAVISQDLVEQLTALVSSEALLKHAEEAVIENT